MEQEQQTIKPSRYAKNKQCIYNWRSQNHDKYNEYQKHVQRKYDNWQKIKNTYLKILLE